MVACYHPELVPDEPLSSGSSKPARFSCDMPGPSGSNWPGATGREPLPLLNRTVLPICSIEVSPHGDLLDEQKGSTAGRVAQGRAGRTHHECARSAGVGVERAAVPTTEEALPRGRRPRPAPRLARAAR